MAKPAAKVKSLPQRDRLAVPKSVRKPDTEYRWLHKAEANLSEKIDDLGYVLVPDPDKPGQPLQRGDLVLACMPKADYDERKAAELEAASLQGAAQAGAAFLEGELAEVGQPGASFGKISVQKGDRIVRA